MTKTYLLVAVLSLMLMLIGACAPQTPDLNLPDARLTVERHEFCETNAELPVPCSRHGNLVSITSTHPFRIIGVEGAEDFATYHAFVTKGNLDIDIIFDETYPCEDKHMVLKIPYTISDKPVIENFDCYLTE